MTLPPGINSRTFSLAVREFERIVGKEWVFSSEEDLSLYRDAYSPLWNEKDEPIPPVAIAPADVEQVRAVVKAANSFRIPLWTISTGKNLGYGGSAPAARGRAIETSRPASAPDNPDFPRARTTPETPGHG